MEARTKRTRIRLIDIESGKTVGEEVIEEVYLIESLRRRLWKNKKFVGSVIYLPILIALLYYYSDKTSIILFTLCFCITGDYVCKTFMEELKK